MCMSKSNGKAKAKASANLFTSLVRNGDSSTIMIIWHVALCNQESIHTHVNHLVSSLVSNSSCEDKWLSPSQGPRDNTLGSLS
jgi:hypothetical protein